MVVVGGKPRFFKDAATAAYVDAIRVLAKGFKPRKPLVGPVELELLLVLPRPKTSLLKEVAAIQGLIRHDGRPDWDNLTKAIQDGLTAALFWHDDGQVSDCIVRKRYAEKNGQARIGVRVRELEVDANIVDIIISDSAAVPVAGEADGVMGPIHAVDFAACCKKVSRRTAAQVKKEQAERRMKELELESITGGGGSYLPVGAIKPGFAGPF
jgi:Holliday junction resolvase RusA-like endonuclease